MQDLKTGLYLQGVAGWTAETNAALDFQNTSRAFEFWRDNDLLNVQLVLKYAESKYGVVLDVLPPRETAGILPEPAVKKAPSARV